MKFGKTEYDLDKIYFSLTDKIRLGKSIEPEVNESEFRIYFGAPAWGDKGFIGKIYPEKTKPNDFLYHYSRNFTAIELNTTYYRIPERSRVIKWYNDSAPDFFFCPKVPMSISGSNDLNQNVAQMDSFLQSVYEFKDKLGLIFLQLPSFYAADKLKNLEIFMDQFPSDVPLNVEFRHPSWFENDDIKNRLFQLLEKHEVGAVISDTSGRRDVLHNLFTSKNQLIRFNGNGLHGTDFTRIDEWVRKIKTWQLNKHVKNLFFIFHQPEEHLCVDLSIYFIQKLKEELTIKLKPPKLIENDQLKLYG